MSLVTPVGRWGRSRFGQSRPGLGWILDPQGVVLWGGCAVSVLSPSLRKIATRVSGTPLGAAGAAVLS